MYILTAPLPLRKAHIRHPLPQHILIPTQLPFPPASRQIRTMHFTLPLLTSLLTLTSLTSASPFSPSTSHPDLVARENDTPKIQYLGSQGGTLSGGTRFGNLVFVSGQVPLLANGTVVPGGIKNETAYVIDRVGAILKEGGTDWSKVLKATVLLQGAAPFSFVRWTIFSALRRRRTRRTEMADDQMSGTCPLSTRCTPP